MEDLEDQIVKYLADNGDTWFPKAELTDKKQWQYEEAQKVKTAISDTISRKLRLAEEAKRIAKRKSGKSGEYRFLPLDKRATYIPYDQRPSDAKNVLFGDVVKKQRTLKQNNTLHLYLSMLATELNDSGNDMRKVLKPTVDIPWSTDTCKRFLWKPIQEVMMDKKSTTELTTDELDKIYKVLDRHVSEKCGIHVEFPSIENSEEYYKSLEQMK
jgi:hypothetical protein